MPRPANPCGIFNPHVLDGGTDVPLLLPIVGGFVLLSRRGRDLAGRIRPDILRHPSVDESDVQTTHHGNARVEPESGAKHPRTG